MMEKRRFSLAGDIEAHSGRIKILSLSWRDIKSPSAGGAEVHTHEMLSRADKNKYEIYHFAMKSKGLPICEKIDGVTYIRKGNALTVILAACCFYRKYRREIDFVIDQCNTHRFFTPLWVKPSKRIFYIHQLTKEIWDYSAKFPLSKLGKAFEESFLRLNRHDPVITVSESTKNDLVVRGYDREKITIIHNGIDFQPWARGQWYQKEAVPTFIYVGRYSPYKGINVAVEALAKLKIEFPTVKLWIVGKKDPKYVNRKLKPVCEKYRLLWEDVETEPISGDIVSWDYVSEKKKLELLSRAWALLFPSVREGWGIPITEAGCVGTPSIAFNSPGICEAVDYGKAGYLCHENTVDGLYKQMKAALLNRAEYDKMQEQAYVFSSQFQWEKTGMEFGVFLDSLRQYTDKAGVTSC